LDGGRVLGKEVISDKQAITLVTVFLIGSTFLIGTAGQAGNDMWISIIIGMILAIPVYLIYCRILSLFPAKGVFEIVEHVFGKWMGKAIGFLYVWFAFDLGALVLRNYGEFINVLALPETPMIVSMALFILLCIWGVKLGIEVLGRWSEAFVIVLYVILIAFAILGVAELKLENLRPILYNGFGPVLGGAFSAFAFPFAEAVVFLCVFGSLKDSKSSYKVYFVGLLIGGASILYVSIRNVAVVGADYLDVLYFPSYTAIAKINIGPFFQRLEIAVAIALLIGVFIKISMCLLATCLGVAKIFELKDYRKIVTPIGLLMLNLSYLVYNSTMEMMDWVSKFWVSYAFPFQVILPIIIWIGCEWKSRKTKNESQIAKP